MEMIKSKTIPRKMKFHRCKLPENLMMYGFEGTAFVQRNVYHEIFMHSERDGVDRRIIPALNDSKFV